MLTLSLRPPELQELSVDCKDSEGKLRKLALTLRVFTYADISWLIDKAGKDWYEKILAEGNGHLAIEILAHQIENGAELETIMGMRLEQGLKRNIPFAHNALVGILEILTDLWQKSLDNAKVDAKKKSREKLFRKFLSIFSIRSLFAFCAGAMAAYAYLTFMP